MSRFVDLHIHTTRSDGSMSPSEIVMYAKYAGLSVIAITDHDTVSGNEEAILEGKRQGIKVIPGVELSICAEHGEIHLLGFFLDYQNSNLLSSLFKLREHRKRRNPLIIQKLKNLGIDLDLGQIRRKANNGNVGRPHIANAMVEQGAVKNVKEAFDLYLKKNGPAYVPKEILSIHEGIRLIEQFGGVPVLAHPRTLDLQSTSSLTDYIASLKRYGLLGVEVYHPGASHQDVRSLEQICQKLELTMTGGSDFHGLDLYPSEAGDRRALAKLPYSLFTNLESVCLANRSVPKTPASINNDEFLPA